MGFAKLVLGVLLAGLGVILLAGHLGYLPTGTGGWMLRYWPALLVLIGLGLLASSLRSPLLGWVATILVIAALGLGAWWVHQHGTGSRSEQATTFDLSRPRTETLTIRARVFGGALSVEPNAKARTRSLDILATGLEGSDVADYTSSGGAAILDWPDVDAHVYQAPFGGNVRVLVPERFRVRLVANSLFSQVRAALARLRPERCDVEAIASSVRIDASGPARPSLVVIHGTLANVELDLPSNCPARLEFAPLTFRTLPEDFMEHAVGRSKTKIWTSDGSGPAVVVRVEGPLIHLKVRREAVRAL